MKSHFVRVNRIFGIATSCVFAIASTGPSLAHAVSASVMVSVPNAATGQWMECASSVGAYVASKTAASFEKIEQSAGTTITTENALAKLDTLIARVASLSRSSKYATNHSAQCVLSFLASNATQVRDRINGSDVLNDAFSGSLDIDPVAQAPVAAATSAIPTQPASTQTTSTSAGDVSQATRTNATTNAATAPVAEVPENHSVSIVGDTASDGNFYFDPDSMVVFDVKSNKSGASCLAYVNGSTSTVRGSSLYSVTYQYDNQHNLSGMSLEGFPYSNAFSSRMGTSRLGIDTKEYPSVSNLEVEFKCNRVSVATFHLKKGAVRPGLILTNPAGDGIYAKGTTSSKVKLVGVTGSAYQKCVVYSSSRYYVTTGIPAYVLDTPPTSISAWPGAIDQVLPALSTGTKGIYLFCTKNGNWNNSLISYLHVDDTSVLVHNQSNFNYRGWSFDTRTGTAFSHPFDLNGAE